MSKVKCRICNKIGYVKNNEKYPKDWLIGLEFNTGKFFYVCPKCKKKTNIYYKLISKDKKNTIYLKKAKSPDFFKLLVSKNDEIADC